MMFPTSPIFKNNGSIRQILSFLIAAHALIPFASGLVTNKRIQIGPLLSTCVDACQRGCLEIRKVQAAREASDNKELQGDVVLKDPTDPKSALTVADTAAQRAIVGSLRAEWGDDLLKIVGEEDDDEELAKSLAEATFEALDRDRFVEEIPTDESGEDGIEANRITVFVDPLDGTREFVEGRVENCQVLVGIAIDGEAVAGAVGMPFPQGNLETDSTIVYGLDGMGTGVVGPTLTRGPFPLERNIDGAKYPRPHHATGDSTAEVMEACRRGAIDGLGGSIVTYGGAGNKILATALGEVTCTIQHRIGGAWDLCAPEAILKAMGGKMTDLFGEELEIYRDDAPPHCNERGYLATPPSSGKGFHEALAAKMMTLPEVQEYKEKVEKM
jgi:3'-phosphoadenosine 5'-phosphosulfate (PAPS) 3'-phosphatase